MLESLIQVAGAWFFVAGAAQFTAAAVEQAGAARSPEEDAPRRKSAALALIVASLMTPALLLLHAFFVTADRDAMVRIYLMSAPIAAMMGGAIVGGVVGALTRAAAPATRAAAPWLCVGALALAAYAAAPTVARLIETYR